MTIARPEKLPRWATDPAGGYPGPIEPSETKKDNGWRNGEAPAAGNVNWLFYDHGQWLQYLDAVSRVSDSALSNQVDVSPSGSDQIEAFAVNTDTGTIIAVGANGAIKKSTDFGKSWASKTPAAAYAGTFRAAAWGGARFVIAGTAGMTQYSVDDGETWVAVTIGSSDHGALAYASGLFVLAGTYSSIRHSSTGGASWSTVGTPGSPGPDPSITHHGGTFVVGNSNTASAEVWTSVDAAATWISHSLSSIAPGMAVTDVTYSPVLGFVAVGNTGTDSWVLTSPDGFTWAEYLHLPGTPTKAFAATGAATACYVFGNGSGARVIDGGVSDRELLQPVNIGTLGAISSRVALLESTAPQASAFFFADETTPGKIYRSQIWSPIS